MMKRYFLAHDDDMPLVEDTQFGVFHYIALDGYGAAGAAWNIVCLHNPSAQPRANWQAFPPIYDPRTTLAASAVDQRLLADLGLTGDETTIEAVMKFGAIHPQAGI